MQVGRRGVISLFKLFLPAFATCRGGGRGSAPCGIAGIQICTVDCAGYSIEAKKRVSSPKYLYLKPKFFNLQEAKIKIRSIQLKIRSWFSSCLSRLVWWFEMVLVQRLFLVGGGGGGRDGGVRG